jgi:hypothetical protein
MGSEVTTPSPAPDRTDIVAGSYAVYVGRQQIRVWQYRVNVEEPDGKWCFIESLDVDDDPRLSLEWLQPTPPGADGYWLYADSYECELDCE